LEAEPESGVDQSMAWFDPDLYYALDFAQMKADLHVHNFCDIYCCFGGA
jgi:hypothetical protein